MRVTARVSTGVPVAAVPEYTLSVTVVESAVALPAAPDSVTDVVFAYEPSAGVVSVTAGATQSDAVVTLAVKWSVAVNAACDERTPWPATPSAASAQRASTARLMPGAPPRRPPPPHARGRRAPTARPAAPARRSRPCAPSARRAPRGRSRRRAGGR